MPLIINSNIMSLTAQRNLNRSQTALATSLQRLSSGLRINSAKDDAAGLAISERFTTQIRGLNQAMRNANDGISLSQTAEGALVEINNNLQRIRELAVQSVNASNSASDRATLDQEVQQRLAEIDRIANQTAFNGQKVLDGSFGTAKFQVGANVGETIGLDLQTSMRQADIGAVATATSGDLSAVLTEGSAATYTFDATDIIGDYSDAAATPATKALGGLTEGVDDDTTNTYNLTFDDSAGNILNINTTNVDTSGGTANGDALAAAFENKGFNADGSGTVNGYTLDLGAQTTIAGAINNGTLTVKRADGVDFSFAEAASGYGTSDPAFANAGTSSTDGVSVKATFTITDPESNVLTVTLDSNITSAGALLSAIQDATGYGAATFTAAAGTGNEIVITDGSNATGSFAIGGANATLITDEVVSSVAGVPPTSMTIADDFTITLGGNDYAVADGEYSTVQSLVDAINTALGSNATASSNEAGTTISIAAGEDVTISGTQGLTTLGFNASNTASGDLSTVNVLDVDASNDTINRIDSALTSVSALRSTFGAIQNRFESTIANLGTTVENLSSSRSRIQDADFAAETAALTRVQILQQAGISVLSQANAQPQSVLALFQ
jgi:flagellin